MNFSVSNVTLSLLYTHCSLIVNVILIATDNTCTHKPCIYFVWLTASKCETACLQSGSLLVVMRQLVWDDLYGTTKCMTRLVWDDLYERLVWVDLYERLVWDDLYERTCFVAAT